MHLVRSGGLEIPWNGDLRDARKNHDFLGLFSIEDGSLTHSESGRKHPINYRRDGNENDIKLA